MSIYVWLQNFWYGLTFLVGKLTGLWDSFKVFKTKVLLQDWPIIFSQRLLTLFIALLGDFILLKTIFQKKIPFSKKFASSLLIIFNPITLTSVHWIKYEAASYLMAIIILYFFFKVEIQGKQKHQKWLLIFMTLSLAVRIELIMFLIGYSFFQVKKSFSIKDYFPLIKPMAIGFVGYLIITLTPVTFLFNLIGSDKADIGDFNNYSGVILYGLLSRISDANFSNRSFLHFSTT